jgi:hypothetical protein
MLLKTTVISNYTYAFLMCFKCRESVTKCRSVCVSSVTVYRSPKHVDMVSYPGQIYFYANPCYFTLYT